ncbi:hypothetical protein Tsubulata_040191 [Turnera subulata]|uniref:Uncharacterized protein n=1 Tax=Turnera subulata TaxID=218843 RepID=A0A9Q0J344_9ROSI|nr:hypothetical protein Tsubulata_040191 [Turnera subulata]
MPIGDFSALLKKSTPTRETNPNPCWCRTKIVPVSQPYLSSGSLHGYGESNSRITWAFLFSICRALTG